MTSTMENLSVGISTRKVRYEGRTMAPYIVTYAYDKRKRTYACDRSGGLRTFKTKTSAQKFARNASRKKSFGKGRLRDTRVKKIKF